MKTWIVGLTTLMISASAWGANTLVCASADAYYTRWTLNGGPQPLPGQLVGKTTLLLGGQVVEDASQFFGVMSVRPWYTISFDGKSKTVIQAVGVQSDSNEVYQIDMIVTSTLPNAVPFRTSVLCREQVRLVP